MGESSFLFLGGQVVPDLLADAMQLQMVSIAVVLKEIGYDIQVCTDKKDGCPLLLEKC